MRTGSTVLTLAIALGLTRGTAQEITALHPDPTSGSARAVVVGDVPLVHTAQIFPIAAEGRGGATDEARAQATTAVERLAKVLDASGSDLGHLVRLNVFATDREDFSTVRDVLAEKLGRLPTLPAVTWTVTPLAKPGARVALDAVAVARPATGDARSRIRVDGVAEISGPTHASILPPGNVVYISGMVGTGDMAAATRSALDQLAGVMEGLGLSPDHVVHVKTFLQPMSSAEASTDAIVDFFGDKVPPPIAHFAWTLGDPIEIELVVAGGGLTLPAEDSGSVQFYNPPSVPASPYYSRVAIVRGGPRIYTSSVTSGVNDEVREMFDDLQDLLREAGSDLEHMAKATYFVRDDETSDALTRVRGEVYNPRRPPAASKAGVADIGFAGRSAALDMIAVPRP